MAIADVLLRLGVNDADVRAALGRVAGDVGQLKRTVEGAFAAVGIGIAARALASFVKSGADAADQLGKMAQKAGLSTEAMSGLAYAAKLGDVPIDDLGGALAKLSKAMAGAAEGGKEQIAAFKELRVKATDAEGNLRQVGMVLEDIADAFAGAEDGAGKAALAMAIFGKSGASLIPWLNGGAKGIRAATDEAEAFGLIVSDETSKAADEFNDNLDRMKALGEGLAVTISAELAPSLNALSNALFDSAKETDALEQAGLKTATSIRYIASAVAGLVGGLSILDALVTTALSPLAAAALAAQGQWESALQVLKNGPKEVVEAQERAAKRIRAIWYGGEDDKLLGPGTMTLTTPGPESFQGQTGKRSFHFGLDEKDKAAAKELADWMREFNRRVDEAEKVMDQVATPAEKYLATLLELDRMHADLGDETYVRAVKAAGDAYFEASGGAKRLADEMSRFNALVSDYEAAVDEAATPLDRYNAQMERLHRLMATTPLTGEQAAALAKKYADELDHATGKVDQLAEAWKKFGEGFQDVLTNQMVDGFNKGLRGMLDAFGDMIKRMLAQAAAAKLSQTLLGGFVSIGKAAAGWSSPYAGGGETADVGGFYDLEAAGYRAAGGPVTGGSAYVIGERGPELFVPSVSGQVVSNEDLAQAAGGSRRVEHFHRFDDRYRRMTVRELIEELMLEEAASR